MKEIVQSVDRALDILTFLSDYPEGISLGNLSKEMNIHKSTAHRLLNTLLYKGFVRQNHDDNNYRLTFELFRLGSSVIEENKLKEVARYYLNELKDLSQEVVHLVLPYGNDIIYIDKFDANQTIRMHSKIGNRSPMYCTSVGKSILATYSDDKIKEIWNSSDIRQLTQYTITSFSDFMQEIEEIRNNGYAEDNQENELQVKCIGAVIKDHSGKAIGAFSISTPIMRLTEEKIENFKKLVVEYSKKISSELGS